MTERSDEQIKTDLAEVQQCRSDLRVTILQSANRLLADVVPLLARVRELEASVADLRRQREDALTGMVEVAAERNDLRADVDRLTLDLFAREREAELLRGGMTDPVDIINALSVRFIAERDAANARADKAEAERDAAGLRWGEHYNAVLADLTAERDELRKRLDGLGEFTVQTGVRNRGSALVFPRSALSSSLVGLVEYEQVKRLVGPWQPVPSGQPDEVYPTHSPLRKDDGSAAVAVVNSGAVAWDVDAPGVAE
jgi:hypothetical protein